jgi:titin
VSTKLGNGQVTLGIWAPIRNGGTSITGYQYTVDGGTTWAAVDAASTASLLLITGLQNGTKYVVKVRALNGAGGGTASAGRSVTPRTTASAPVITSLTGSSGKIMVTFDVPLNNGGSVVTRFGYSINGGTWRNFGGSASPQWIKGLKNGVTYSIRIKALNAAGWSAASDAVEVTPRR